MGAERLERLGHLVELLEDADGREDIDLDEVRAEIRELIHGYDGTLAQGLRDRIDEADATTLGGDPSAG